MTSIFNEGFLSSYLSDFSLSSIADARGKVAILNSLISEQQSGKLSLLKEEEVKSRFINAFFGDVLGFNYGNPGKWLLREEKKTRVDGTKPDAALGFFSNEDIEGDVRAIVEMKDINTDLDKKQKSRDNRSPVDQAFDYVSKMGGKCKWVVVSNIKEIRFYPSLDRSRFQLFLLDELSKEAKIKELLFLFHKDRFIKEIGVSTADILFERVKNRSMSFDRPLHILDKIYTTIKGFQGLNYVDPNYIANIPPFNILNDDVWHYKNRLLVTLNPQIYGLLSEVKIEEEEIILSDEFIGQLSDNGVIEGLEKLKECFAFLRQCGIEKFRAIKDYKAIEERNKSAMGFSIRHIMGTDDENDNVTLKISRPQSEVVCDCILCNYRNFEHTKLINKLKMAVGDEDFDTMEFAYGDYLLATDNFRAAYLTYKRIERKTKGKEGRAVEYFLAKKNIKNLAKDLLYHNTSDNATMRNDVKSTDLDKVIYDEVEFEVSRIVKNYIVQIKGDALIYEVQDEIDDSFHQVEGLKRYYDGQGKRPNMFTGVAELIDSYYRLHLHVHNNYIVYVSYGRYKYLCQKYFRGLILSLQTPKEGITKLFEFALTEAILNIAPATLKDILDGVDAIPTSPDCTSNVINKFHNFLTCFYKQGIFGDPDTRAEISEQLNNYAFQTKFNQFFANFFSILSRLDLSQDDIDKVKKPLQHFLVVEDQLYWVELDEMKRFLSVKGDLFEPNELVEILKISLERDRYNINKYQKLISTLPSIIHKFHPSYKLENQFMVEMALLKCRSSDDKRADYKRVVNLVKICSQQCKQILFDTFEKYLDKEFNGTFYELLINETDYSLNRKGYFERYVMQIKDAKDKHTYRFGKHGFTDVIYIKFIYLIYDRQVSYRRKEFNLLINLNDFERWLLDPKHFDYEKFNLKWLDDVWDTDLMKTLKQIGSIRIAVRKQLAVKYDVKLAEIYSKLTDAGT